MRQKSAHFSDNILICNNKKKKERERKHIEMKNNLKN